MKKKCWLVIIPTLFCLVMSTTRTRAAEKMLTDQLGRKVVMTQNPVRVIALIPSIVEIVFDLGQGNRLIGVTRYADFPPEAKKIPRIGTYISLDIEKILFLNPDLCIGTKDGNNRDQVLALESLNVPVYVLDPRNLDSIITTVLEIGKILNVPDQAERLKDQMQKRIDRVDALVSKIDHRPRVFFQIGVAPIVSVGKSTYINELIARAGGINLAGEMTGYPRFSVEQVLGLAPEVIIITSMERDQVFEQVKADWEQWPDLPAVRNKRITVVDSNILDRPTPRMVDGLEMLVKIIHPELFGKQEGLRTKD